MDNNSFTSPEKALPEPRQPEFADAKAMKENREAYERCYAMAWKYRADLQRIQRFGPSPGDDMFVRIAAALACWELRKQTYLNQMFEKDHIPF
jgi:hypothetical protein